MITKQNISAVAKGREFEQEVADWLVNDLSHRVVLQNEWVECARNLKPFECDVHTRTSIPFWDQAQKLGIALVLFAALAFFLNAREFPHTSLTLGMFGIFLVATAHIKKQKRNYHVWVECKNLKTKVTREHIRKLHDTTSMLKKYRAAQWRPDLVYCFSATDFERDAISVARQHRITCYRRSPAGFERID